MSNFKSIKEYFSGEKTIVVPYYQRGYKWSLQKNSKRGDLHLNLLLLDLKNEFQYSLRNGQIIKNYEYYLQGITVKEKENEIELVDGQQRTTSIFILLCCLKYRGIDISINLQNKLHYKVRKAANILIQQFINGNSEGDETIQDIAALKKAWILCNKTLDGISNLELFSQFLLENIKIIYIQLDKNQDETKVFSMMNKNKAEMSQTDLIKSNILREASRQMFGDLKDKVSNDGLEWQINQLRGKLASEWDNWRKWWEKKDHKDFGKMIGLNFSITANKNSEPDMVVIFRLYQSLKQVNLKTDSRGLYEYFKDIAVNKSNDKLEAIEVFEELRLIQLVIEEWYNEIEIYNYLGLFFKGSGIRDRESQLIVLYKLYTESKLNFIQKIKGYYVKQVIEEHTVDEFIDSILSDTDTYHNQYTTVARQLLRMNVLMASKQKQKFDFSLYEENNYRNSEDIDNASKRSLEHIKPQTYRNSKISKKERDSLKKLTNTIGNLVLVPRGLNSKLSNKLPEEKKKILFEEMLKPDGRNFGLWLHTLSVFGSQNSWLSKEIIANQEYFKNDLLTYFNSKQ
jgi:uncharacterized protein with ParB-like and HNH nuclease domain